MSKELQPGQPCEVLCREGMWPDVWRKVLYIGASSVHPGECWFEDVTGHAFRTTSGRIRPILSREERIEQLSEEAVARYAATNIAMSETKRGQLRTILRDLIKAVCDAAREEETG